MANRVKVLGLVLAGGEGKRLAPLTRDRAKPAVPFGANYRLIDFVLSNLVNANCLRIAVLTQYKSHSLDRHLAQTWRLSPIFNNYVMSVPAQMRTGKRWFEGSADAILQNMNLILDDRPDYVYVFGADHIYRMDPAQMLRQHIDSGAGVTIAGIRVPRQEASRYGVLQADGEGRIEKFEEKPQEARGLPDSPDEVLASMGNYIFSTKFLVEAIRSDAEDLSSNHDMGGDIVTKAVQARQAYVYDFAYNLVPGATDRDKGYWRDVGTLDSYYESNMELVSVHPVFNLYNDQWPIHTWYPSLPPAKFVFDEDGRRGHAVDSLVSAGALIAGGTVRGCVVSPSVVVHSGALVERCVLMDGADIGRGSIVRRAIIDKNVVIPPGCHIGVDLEDDRSRGFTISEGGTVVIGKGDPVPMQS